jgi:two-component system sensor histidine kinase RegB
MSSHRSSRFDTSGDATIIAPDGSALHGLKLLAILRVCAPITQWITLQLAVHQFDVHIPLGPIYVLLAVEAVVAALTWWRVRKRPRVGTFELVAQAHLDIALFTVMLYLTGGTTNPFAPLFVLPMAITASARTSRWVWLAAISTMAAYAFLRFHHVPLFHPAGETEVYDLHEDGMVVNYLFTAALLAYFVARMHAALRRRERELAEARDAQMRDDSVVALGAMAAGHAHELSTPLATMAVVVGELKRTRASDEELMRDLTLIDEQIRSIKQIVSNLTEAAGHRRAEAVSGMRLDRFLGEVFGRARLMHPGANIVSSIDAHTTPPVVVVDESLRQAITNLIDNAVRVSPGQVSLSAGWVDGILRVVVTDRGPGFDAAVLERLGKTPRGGRADGGMGMGLVLTAYTLERLGGTLELRNQGSGGARAEVQLPLQAITLDGARREAA